MEPRDSILSLFEKYLANQCSPTEVDQLIDALQNPEYESMMTELLDKRIAKELPEEQVSDPSLKERLGTRLEYILNSPTQTVQAPVRRFFSWKKIAVAATLIGLAGILVFKLWPGKKEDGMAGNGSITANDVKAPVSTHATITLANGQEIALDDVSNGALALEGNAELVKLDSGRIAYTIKQNDGEQQPVYNTLSNPRGSNIVWLTLSDGTKVWLNSESSLRYPTAFAGKERRVEVTGEAYFEVAHNKTAPFIVTHAGATVTVLGTHFNINAYADEPGVKVTLLEGSVSVDSRQSTVNSPRVAVLKPGQQALVNSSTIQLINPDIQQVMAWKNGFFHFEKAGLEEVLRQLTRWYDVEIVYEGKIPARQFVGEMERSLNLSQVLKILEKNGVHFRIEGKKIIVMP